MLKESQFEQPPTRVLMVSPRNFRLSSRKGFVVNFLKNEPVWVPPHIYEEALAIGAEPCAEQPEQAPPKPDPRQIAKETHEHAAALEKEAKTEYIKQACLALLARGDNTDFRADGYPKANKVVAELSPDCPRPTATEIQEVFDVMREDMSLAED